MLHPHPAPSKCDRAQELVDYPRTFSRSYASKRDFQDDWKTRASVFSFLPQLCCRGLPSLQVSGGRIIHAAGKRIGEYTETARNSIAGSWPSSLTRHATFQVAFAG